MAQTPADLLLACWKTYTTEMVVILDAATDTGAPAKVTAEIYQAMVNTRASIMELMAKVDVLEQLYQGWKDAGLLDDKIAMAKARKLLDVTVERKDDN